MSDLPVGVVGGGIVGLAVARELVRRHDGLEVVVFEKEDRLAAHQSGHNSGVVHAGIYYAPGSLKAQLCARGRALLREFCDEHRLPFEERGKLVVAVEASELPRLDTLEARARANEVPGMRRIDGAEIAELEPHATGASALHSPRTAITDFVAVASAFAAEVEGHGGSVLRSTEVTGLAQRGGAIEVSTAHGVRRVGALVICAGLQADRVGRAFDRDRDLRIVPFRGEYLSVVGPKRDLVRSMIYPVPDPRYPFLGVHFTRRVTGELDVGPNAVLALKREGYRRRDIRLTDVGATLTWPGFWRLAREHWRMGLAEMRGSISVRAYMRTASRYVPEITHRDVVRAGAGVRAQALGRDGSLVDDFRISRDDRVTSIRNAPSPAATSSLAIAEYVVDQMGSPI